jgi:hypothetical protein
LERSIRRLEPVAPVAGANECFQVGAGAKGAVVAEENSGAGLVIGFEGFERLDQFRRGRWIDGVSRVGPVQDHRRDLAIPLNSDGHDRPLSFGQYRSII